MCVRDWSLVKVDLEPGEHAHTLMTGTDVEIDRMVHGAVNRIHELNEGNRSRLVCEAIANGLIRLRSMWVD